MAKLGNFEFGELIELQRKLRRMQQDYPAFVEECIREIALRLLAKTVARTPVDTGLLRRSWQITAVRRVPGGYQVDVFNPVEYAKFVEFGHRTASGTGWVEGRFMLTISERELQREMPGLLDRKIKTFMDQHLS
ncbi:hypothetical protein CIG75_18980 [Tumebacillus algifaecis]|uniref:HK97 gp10 family phage protein n=1 Tax=Tumebacillus algifaecis TaxID=1214604 RepID=A0A223D5D9_9BACL|nr:HK97 gp10 family phage protein [Tumebacillus algifaecis]ASS76819.1 hypothetical protein CIG75_18980 [Tumebacillus algifaecis]